MPGKLSRNPFANNVALLICGTAISQAILVLSAPFLTRLFNPDAFGIYQTFTSILSFGLVAASLRYDVAIILPDEDKTSAHVLLLSAINLLFVTVGLIAFCLSLEIWEAPFGNLPFFVPCLALSFFLGGATQILNYWALRQKAFKVSTSGKMIQVAGQTSLAITGGFFKAGSSTLLIADVAGRLLFFTWLCRNFAGELATLLRGTKGADIKNAAIRYKDFPLVSLFGSIINTAGIALTPLLIFKFYGPTAAGLFALTDRILGAPSALVGSSVAQVYLSEAASLKSTNPEQLRETFTRIIKCQLKLGILPLIVLLVAGPWIFSHLFGDAWTESGSFARGLALAYYISFAMWPVNMTLNVLEKQKWQLWWDCGRLSIAMASWTSAKMLGMPIQLALYLHGAGMIVSYLGHFFLCRRAISSQIEVGRRYASQPA